jgi:ribosomal protein S18 acetylase RimI-like enzyme
VLYLRAAEVERSSKENEVRKRITQQLRSMTSTSRTSLQDLVLRRASKADLEAVWNMWKEIMDQKKYYPYDDCYSRQYIEDEWVNLKNTLVVATATTLSSDDDDDTEQTVVVGAYILKANQPGYGRHVVNAAYMVDNVHRGMNIGNLLCQHSLQTAKSEGYRGMQFNLVVSTNVAAISVWKRNGFQIIGTVPEGFYHAEKQCYVDAYIFYKSLL